MASWYNFISDVVLWAAAVIAIFEGTRRFVLGGSRRTSVGLVIGGLVWCTFNSAVAFYISPTLNSLKVSEPDKTVSELPAVWDNYFPLKERETKSRAYALIIYNSTGSLVGHFDENGNRQRFVPTQDEHRQRESVVILQQQMDFLSREAYARGFRWIVTALFALLVGGLTGRHQIRTAANQLLQTGPAEGGRPLS